MNNKGIVVTGIKGRMGKLISQEAAKQHTLVGGTVREKDPANGKDLMSVGLGNFGNGPVDADLNTLLNKIHTESETTKCVIIDFTAPDAMVPHLDTAIKHQTPMVIGTTGLNAEQRNAIEEASKHIPILYAANTSLGANLLHWITEKVAHAMPEADVEVMEIHHRQKKDAPSGTATWLAQGICEAGDRGPMIFNRVEHGTRQAKEVGVSALRGGDVPGEHTAYFFLDGERIEISHRAQNRYIFAQGAVAAAIFLLDKPAGRYSMNDVLGLN